VERLVLERDKVCRHLEGRTLRKLIVVPDPLVNIVLG
jgi:hypothetical protein